jgi:hypothetical protein
VAEAYLHAARCLSYFEYYPAALRALRWRPKRIAEAGRSGSVPPHRRGAESAPVAAM